MYVRQVDPFVLKLLMKRSLQAHGILASERSVRGGHDLLPRGVDQLLEIAGEARDLFFIRQVHPIRKACGERRLSPRRGDFLH
jgi:hypothetical protein